MRPSLLLDFANTRRLDPRITFTRASTGTYFDRFGVLKTAGVNEPRFDHDLVTGDCLGLLIEEARTNMLPYSDNDPGWQVLGTTPPTVDSNNWTEDGLVCTKTTFPVIAAGGYAVCRAQGTQASGVVSGSPYIHSSWLKLSRPLTGGEVLHVFATGATGLTNFPVNAANSASFLSWGRVMVASPVNATANGLVYYCLFAQKLDSPLTVYSARRQVELGSGVSSFIPTAGAATTRAADIASITGSNFSQWFNSAEGTLLVAADRQALNATRSSHLASMSDGSTSNGIILHADSAALRSFSVDAGGVSSCALTSGVEVAGQAWSAAAAYKANDFALSVGGTMAMTDSSGALPAINQLYLGNRFDGARGYNGHISRFAYYPRRLANADLQGLTR